MKADFIYNPSEAGSHAHCATLHQCNNGDLLCVWYGHPDKEDYKDAQLCLSRLQNGSNTWSKSEPLLGKFESSAGNPVIFQEPKTDILWLFFVLLKGTYWTDAVMHSCYSLDNGYSWSAPVVAWPDKGIMIRHHPIYLDSGDPLLPVYDEINEHTLLFRREGHDWTIADAFPDFPLIQPTLFQEQNGRLTLLFRPVKEPKIIWRAHSSDQGKTWSTLIRTNLPCPLSGVAGFATEQGIAAIYNHADHGRTPLSLAFSRDGGIVWSEPWHLDKMDHEVSYPHFITTKDNWIHGVYTYNRRMIKYVSFSFDELHDRLQ